VYVCGKVYVCGRCMYVVGVCMCFDHRFSEHMQFSMFDVAFNTTSIKSESDFINEDYLVTPTSAY